MAKRGRPVKYTPAKLKEIESKLLKYIDDKTIPILAEFSYKNNLNREELYRHQELNHAIKKCIDKKQANLEKLALGNKINSTMAIFSLKQLGWRDKQEIEHSGGIQIKGNINWK